jgi:hypothetical protein
MDTCPFTVTAHVEDTSDSRSPRFLILLGVIAFHAAILSVLMAASHYPVDLTSPSSIELFLLPPPSTQPKGRPLSSRVLPPDRHLPPLPSDALTVVVPLPASPANDGTKRDVDWGEEAHRAAETAADENSPVTAGDKPDSSSSSGSFTAPRHHAGEQFKLDTGDWIVWINNYCYQVSEWAPRSAGWSGVSLPKTICPQSSNSPRADLFKDVRR